MSTLSGASLVAKEGCIESGRERTTLEPWSILNVAELYSGPIIDPHIHLWDLDMDRHPWLRPTGGAIQALGDLAPIRQNYLVDDYRRDAAKQNVVASVHIEAAWDRADDPLAEIEWLETLDKSSGVAARYIGFADLTAPNASATLDRLSEVKRCVGVRQMLSWHPTEPAQMHSPHGLASLTRRTFAAASRCSPATSNSSS